MRLSGLIVSTATQIADTLVDLRGQVKTLSRARRGNGRQVARVRATARRIRSRAWRAVRAATHTPDAARFGAETAMQRLAGGYHLENAGNPASGRRIGQGALADRISPPVRPQQRRASIASLADARRAARSGDADWYPRYNGRLDEQPLSLSGVRLTVRAGEGFAPIVGFQPRQEAIRGIKRTPMLALPGSQLTLLNSAAGTRRAPRRGRRELDARRNPARRSDPAGRVHR